LQDFEGWIPTFQSKDRLHLCRLTELQKRLKLAAFIK